MGVLLGSYAPDTFTDRDQWLLSTICGPSYNDHGPAGTSARSTNRQSTDPETRVAGNLELQATHLSRRHDSHSAMACRRRTRTPQDRYGTVPRPPTGHNRLWAHGESQARPLCICSG